MKKKVTHNDRAEAKFDSNRFRRHYVSAVDDDSDVSEDHEKSKLGRVFTLLLLVHVFLIGAVVCYNIIANKTRSSDAPVARATAPAATQAPAVAVPHDGDTNSQDIPAADPGAMDEFIVSSGQSLQSIAAITGVPMAEIIRINNLSSTGTLDVGVKLQIPKARNSVPSAIPIDPASMTALSAPGTTSDIPAKGAPAPMPDIMAVPPVVQDDLPKAPPVAANTSSQTVKSTPPTADVSKTDAPAKARPGTQEAKPVAKVDTKPAPKAEPKAAAKPASKGGSYEVKSGDTFYGIAKKHGVSPTELMKANGAKDAGALRIGAKLKIPAK